MSLPTQQEFLAQMRPNGCPLCRQIMLNPTQAPCGHFFCYGCLQRYLETSHSCPLCNTVLYQRSNPGGQRFDSTPAKVPISTHAGAVMPPHHMLPGASFGGLTIVPPIPVPAALITSQAYDACVGAQSSDERPPGDQHMPPPQPPADSNSSARDTVERVVRAARNIRSVTTLYDDAGLPGTLVANSRDRAENAFIEGFLSVHSDKQNDALAKLAEKPNDAWKGKMSPFYVRTT